MCLDRIESLLCSPAKPPDVWVAVLLNHAEGDSTISVETRRQLHKLRSLPCPHIQYRRAANLVPRRLWRSFVLAASSGGLHQTEPVRQQLPPIAISSARDQDPRKIVLQHEFQNHLRIFPIRFLLAYLLPSDLDMSPTHN